MPNEYYKILINMLNVALTKYCKCSKIWNTSCCSSRLIRVFPVCYSGKHFVTSGPENQHLRTEGVFKILKHLLYCLFTGLCDCRPLVKSA